MIFYYNKNLKKQTNLEKEMATHSIILAWKIQWMEGRLQSVGSQTVEHN